MNIQEAAYNSSRQALADNMRRRQLSRQLEQIAQFDPGALDRAMAPRAPVSVRGGNRVVRGGSYGYSGGAGGGGGVGWNSQDIVRKGETFPGGDADWAIAHPSNDESRGVAVDKSLDALDQSRARIKAISDKMYKDAYGAETGGAYGSGITTPGGAPDEAFQKALALKQAGKAGAKPVDLALSLARAQAADAASAMPQGDANPLVALYKARMAEGGAPAAVATGATEDPAPAVSSLINPDGLSMGGNTPQMRKAIASKLGIAGNGPLALPGDTGERSLLPNHAPGGMGLDAGGAEQGMVESVNPDARQPGESESTWAMRLVAKRRSGGGSSGGKGASAPKSSSSSTAGSSGSGGTSVRVSGYK